MPADRLVEPPRSTDRADRPDRSNDADADADAHSDGSERFRSIIDEGMRAEVRGYERSPIAALRMVVGLVAIGLVVASTELLPMTWSGLEVDLQTGAEGWLAMVGRLAGSTAAAISLIVIIGAAIVAWMTDRLRPTLSVMLAAGVGLLMGIIAARIGGLTPGRVVSEEWALTAVIAAMAVLNVSFTVLRSLVWRSATAAISVPTLLSALDGGLPPSRRVLALLAGMALGAIVAVAVGTPWSGLSDNELLESLRSAQLAAVEVTPLSADARGSIPWRARLATDRDAFVKVLVADQRSADLLFRLWRRIRLKDPGDGLPASSLRRAAEHEAFVSDRARNAGVATPELIGVGPLRGDRGAFAAFEMVDAVTFDEAPELDDATLRSAWSAVNALHRAGIAHRDLRTANLMVDADGEPLLIDFGFSEVAATDELLDIDVVELLCSSAALVGNERATDAAVSVLGPERIERALPWIQPLAVSGATRNALTRSDFELLREHVRSVVDAPSVELPHLERVRIKTVVTTVSLAVALWVLLPQVSSGMEWDRVIDAKPGWAGVAVLASVATYVGAALSLRGGVAGTAVPVMGTFAAQIASSFTNRITPAKVGGLALNVRYLAKQGLDKAVATTAVAVTTAAGAVVHVALMVVAVIWAGNVGLGDLKAPSARTLGITGSIVAVVVGTTFVVPPFRRWFFDTALPPLRRSLRSMREVVSTPRNLMELIGGSLIVTASNIVALDVSLRAFGASVPASTVSVVYLASAAIASAAPTPGGLGATEAALVGGLSVTGTSEADALPAVLLFRVATFWLPILPGWFAMTMLQRRGDL